jgi:hypothetical protein
VWNNATTKAAVKLKVPFLCCGFELLDVAVVLNLLQLIRLEMAYELTSVI